MARLEAEAYGSLALQSPSRSYSFVARTRLEHEDRVPKRVSLENQAQFLITGRISAIRHGGDLLEEIFLSCVIHHL